MYIGSQRKYRLNSSNTVPPEFYAAYAEHGYEGPEEDQAGDGEDSHLHRAQPRGPTLPPQHDLPHAHVLEGVEGEGLSELLAGDYGVARQTVEPDLRHEAGGTNSAGGNLGSSQGYLRSDLDSLLREDTEQ